MNIANIGENILGNLKTYYPTSHNGPEMGQKSEFQFGEELFPHTLLITKNFGLLNFGHLNFGN